MMKTGVRVKRVMILIAAVSLSIVCRGQSLSLERCDVGDLGSFDKWCEIEIALTGPDMQGQSGPNPFAINLDVTFTSPTDRQDIRSLGSIMVMDNSSPLNAWAEVYKY